jgi:hypothetical protein
VSGAIVWKEGSPLRRRLEAIAASDRIAVIAGIPGAGKSLVVQQLVTIARAAGRKVYLFQWDVARTAFETPALLARFPELDGVTHPAIIGLVGRWIRDAVVAWEARCATGDAFLVGEAPLIGGRMIELAMPGPEPAESLLTAATTRFLVPVPSIEVRRAIESRRAATSAAPRHRHEAADARPGVVRDLWRLLVRQGMEAGIIPPVSGEAVDRYDPSAYWAVYRHWLRHRRSERLMIEELAPVAGSVYDVGPIEGELRATPREVAGLAGSIR